MGFDERRHAREGIFGNGTWHFIGPLASSHAYPTVELSELLAKTVPIKKPKAGAVSRNPLLSGNCTCILNEKVYA